MVFNYQVVEDKYRVLEEEGKSLLKKLSRKQKARLKEKGILSNEHSE